MKVATVSVVVGSYGCNAKCPFCVANQTPHVECGTNINEADMHIGCRLGQMAGATTCLITGKGEPTLFPKPLTRTIELVAPYFPFVELQTNGMKLIDLAANQKLAEWYKLGLRTICLSTTHWDVEYNKMIYGKDYLDWKTVKSVLNAHQLRLRLSIIMHHGGVDNLEKLIQCIDTARELGKQGRKVQLTARPVVVWDNDSKASQWAAAHLVQKNNMLEIHEWLADKPVTMVLPNGAKVYDIDGQNFCLTDCLTTNPNTEEIRQIIIYPDGTISYDWKYEGAILM